MDKLISEISSLNDLQLHFYGTPGSSPLNLDFNPSSWNWNQLIDPFGFEFVVGQTPLSDLGVIKWTWLVYFSVILVLKAFMYNRKPYQLRMATAIHNLILCLGSLLMFIAGVVGVYEAYQAGGMLNVYVMEPDKSKGILFYALYIFYLSKFPELIDTVILVLKKKNVIFLHWYHHAIVLLMTWTWLQGRISYAAIGLIFNTAVHVFMYWYYFASNMGWAVWYKKFITSFQIFQFIMSFVLTMPVFYYERIRPSGSISVTYLSMLINATFLALFIRFYLNTYKKVKSKKE